MPINPAPLPSIGLVLDEIWPAGLFAVSGQDAGLRVNRQLVAEYGEFTLTGQDSTDTYSGAITAVNPAPLPPLSFLTFGTAGQYVLPCEFGSFVVSGQDATLTKGRQLICEFGSFAVSGAPALRDMELTADVRLFQVLGQDASLTVGPRTLTADYGSFSMTGLDATLTYEQVGAKVLNCEAGIFSMSSPGQLLFTQITMTVNRVLACDFGSFVLSGRSATLIGPKWQDVSDSAGTWTYVTPSGGVWIDVDPDS